MIEKIVGRRKREAATPVSELGRYRRMLEIDRDDLDEAIARQPIIFEEVSDRYAEARSERDALEAAIDREVADAAQEIRESMIKERKGEKITETEIKQEVARDPKVLRVKSDFLQAKLESSKWEGLMESFKQRQYMLRSLVDMYTARLASTGTMRSKYDVAREAVAEAGRKRD